MHECLGRYGCAGACAQDHHLPEAVQYSRLLTQTPDCQTLILGPCRNPGAHFDKNSPRLMAANARGHKIARQGSLRIWAVKHVSRGNLRYCTSLSRWSICRSTTTVKTCAEMRGECTTTGKFSMRILPGRIVEPCEAACTYDTSSGVRQSLFDWQYVNNRFEALHRCSRWVGKAQFRILATSGPERERSRSAALVTSSRSGHGVHGR
jgi:hypothetical protein